MADVIYQKESKWNVYQEATYHLSKRLSGITSICFVLHQKIHIKGFLLKRRIELFKQLRAIDCDHIYGDTFSITEKCVERIGNNVSLEFEQMDFTAEGATKLIIYGRSTFDKNTIHVHFDNQESQCIQLIEFLQCDGYEEQIFELEKVTGIQMVTFLFLPGSNFDFGWFRFGGGK